MKMNFDIFNDDDKTLKTDKLSIKNNTILMKNDAIQIKNISMMSSSELVFRLKFSEILMMLVMILALFIDFIPKVIPLVILLFWGYSIYNKYQKHLSEKFYIEFNLGSSKNYYLFLRVKNLGIGFLILLGSPLMMDFKL
ncbi:hypothetical protein N1495_09585 [Streptococcus didelphis]|uniref:hypothetical protein n=1 Tax=Streptococcus didelphis TaxID=102886 RepID=UPI0027D33B27|nr:hypothetical protein [Streptococcus didelphis]WMB29498.1 hypothetical protein N1495_09585 [Streptococcus didelphis]